MRQARQDFQCVQNRAVPQRYKFEPKLAVGSGRNVLKDSFQCAIGRTRFRENIERVELNDSVNQNSEEPARLGS